MGNFHVRCDPGEKTEIISKSYLWELQICRELAGYSYGRADIVRRAMSKKKYDVMLRERENFVHGIVDDNGNVVQFI